jgi:hypothetical protein
MVGPDLMEMIWNYGRLMFEPENPDGSDEESDYSLTPSRE